MSKIQSEVLAACGLKTVRNEDRQACIARLMGGVSALNDDQWEALSQEAQDWFNSAADAKNAKKKVLPDFPDLDEEEEEEVKPEVKTGRRGGKPAAKEAATSERLTKVGDTATVTTKRGKSVTGKVVEIDDDVVVIEVDGEEQEFAMERVETVHVKHGDVDEDEPEVEVDVKVGDLVTVTTKRGKTATGELLELDDDVVVIEDEGEEQEFNRDRVESIVPFKGKIPAKAEAEPAKAGRRAAKEEPAKEEKGKRSVNEGVSVGTRIKELIAENLDASEEAIGKILKKEGLEFRDNTLKLNYVDAHKFVTILRAKKLLK